MIMGMLTEREKWEIGKIADDKFYYSSLPERHKTAAVSLAAVSACGNSLEYVPETVLSKDICRAALGAKDADCTLLPYIPFPDVQQEGIRQFSGNTPAFVLYSFADIQDAKMAQDAVRADAYCLQLVPDKLMTTDICKTALLHPDADKKVFEFIPPKFRNNPDIKKLAEEKFGVNSMQKEISPPEKKTRDSNKLKF